jgi:hypothetical protein
MKFSQMKFFESERMDELANQDNELIFISDDDESEAKTNASDTDDSYEEEKYDESNEERNDKSKTQLNTTVHQITTWFNPDPLKVHMENTKIAVISDEQFALTAGFTDGSNDPVN